MHTLPWALFYTFSHFAHKIMTGVLPVLTYAVKPATTLEALVLVATLGKIKRLWLWIEIRPQRWEFDLFILLWRQSLRNCSFSLLFYVPLVLSQLFVRLVAKRRLATLTVVALKFSFNGNIVLPFVAYFVHKSALSPRKLLVAVTALILASFWGFEVSVDCDREGHIDCEGSLSGFSRGAGHRMQCSPVVHIFHLNVCSF
jgi:hypothetical protein